MTIWMLLGGWVLAEWARDYFEIRQQSKEFTEKKLREHGKNRERKD